jgi:hypothetical protein
MLTNKLVTYTYREGDEVVEIKTRAELSALIDEKIGDTLPKEATVDIEVLKEFGASPNAPVQQ